MDRRRQLGVEVAGDALGEAGVEGDVAVGVGRPAGEARSHQHPRDLAVAARAVHDAAPQGDLGGGQGRLTPRAAPAGWAAGRA